MAMEDVKPKAESIYYGYNEPDSPRDNYKRLKKDDFIEGYFFRSFERDSLYGKQLNHVFIDTNNIHHILPGSKDLDKDVKEYLKKGVLTRATYLGKINFDYIDADGKKGVAKAIKYKLQQDNESTCTFEGDVFAAKVNIGKPSQQTDQAEVTITSEDVPF